MVVSQVCRVINHQDRGRTFSDRGGPWRAFARRGISPAVPAFLCITLAVPAFLCTSTGSEYPDGWESRPLTVKQIKRTAGPKLLGHLRGNGGTTISADGSRVATCSKACGLSIWDGKTGRLVIHVKDPHPNTFPEFLAADAKFQRVLTVGPSRRRSTEEYYVDKPLGKCQLGPWRGADLKVWDAGSGRTICSLKMSDRSIPIGAAIRPDGLAVGCVDVNLDVKVWDLREPEPVRIQFSVPRKPRDLLHLRSYGSMARFSKNLVRVAAVEYDKAGGRDRIYVCDLQSGRSMFIPMPTDVAGEFEEIAINPEGTEVVAWANGKKKGRSLCRFDFESGEFLATFLAPDYEVVPYFDYSSDGEFLVLGGHMGRLSILEARSGTSLAECKLGNEIRIRSLVILDGRIRALWGDGFNNPPLKHGDPRFDNSTALNLTDFWIHARP